MCIRDRGVSQRAIRAKGVSLVPEDRMLYGIAADATIEENMISDRCDAKRLNKGLLFDMKAIHKEVDQLIADYTVLCKSSRQKVGSLSGGNIQKVVVAREFSNSPCLIIADQPTRGIDVGAKYEIYQLILDLARDGKGVIMVSSEMPELLGICDRILVMSGGRLAGEVDAANTSQEEILTLAAKYV